MLEQLNLIVTAMLLALFGLFQLVHYPSFAFVQRESFTDFSASTPSVSQCLSSRSCWRNSPRNPARIPQRLGAAALFIASAGDWDLGSDFWAQRPLP